MDDDVVFLESLIDIGKGRWADVKDKCYEKHKCVGITDSAKFQKHFNNINNKQKSKYFKPYKHRQFKQLKGKHTKYELNKLEEEHIKKVSICTCEASECL